MTEWCTILSIAAAVAMGYEERASIAESRRKCPAKQEFEGSEGLRSLVEPIDPLTRRYVQGNPLVAQRLDFSAQVAVPHTTARGHECPTCALIARFNFRKLNLCRVLSDVLHGK